MINYLQRDLGAEIEKWLDNGLLVIVYGARQVGKTTLVKSLLEKQNAIAGYFNCDLPEVREVLESQNHSLIKDFIGRGNLVVFDEAQQVREIGKILKILHDVYPELKIIATGSSSFELANKLSEPLTGRSVVLPLYPFSLAEMEKRFNRFELKAKLEEFLIYGQYPAVVLAPLADRPPLLRNLADNYLYRDVLMFENLRRADILKEMLKLLALQIGSEVSMHEIAGKLKCGIKTAERYLELLEKSFVVFRLRPFSRNLRNEIGKKSKVFFYDLGVRNAIIDRFSGMSLRDDIGGMWENFCVIERMKANQRAGNAGGAYFWRNHAGKEVDYLEERDGKIAAFEFKYGAQKYRAPQDFLSAYNVKEVQIVNRENIFNFAM